MQDPKSPLYQLIGEHIRSFAWRVDMAYGLTLSHDLLTRKVLKGLTPNILWNMPSQKSEWTLQSLFEFGDNLPSVLLPDDPHLGQPSQCPKPSPTLAVSDVRILDILPLNAQSPRRSHMKWHIHLQIRMNRIPIPETV